VKALHAREFNTLVFCRGVLDNHAALVGDINSSGSRAELDAAIQAISELAAEQELGKRHRTAFRLAARKATRDLRRAMRPVAEVAKSNFQRVPEFEALYMPRVSIGTQSLVAAANAMATAAQPLTRTFLDAGLSAAFMDNIRARATSLTEITGNQAHAGVVRSGATAGIRAAIKRGRRAVAVIDALLIPMLEEAPDVLVAWKTAKRVPAKPGAATGTIIHPRHPERSTPSRHPERSEGSAVFHQRQR
jgi:hypothetical protein